MEFQKFLVENSIREERAPLLSSPSLHATVPWNPGRDGSHPQSMKIGVHGKQGTSLTRAQQKHIVRDMGHQSCMPWVPWPVMIRMVHMLSVDFFQVDYLT